MVCPSVPPFAERTKGASMHPPEDGDCVIVGRGLTRKETVSVYLAQMSPFSALSRYLWPAALLSVTVSLLSPVVLTIAFVPPFDTVVKRAGLYGLLAFACQVNIGALPPEYTFGTANGAKSNCCTVSTAAGVRNSHSGGALRGALASGSLFSTAT